MCSGICYIRQCTCGEIIDQCACKLTKKRVSLHTGARGCPKCVAAWYREYPKPKNLICLWCGDVDPDSDDCYETVDGYHVFGD